FHNVNVDSTSKSHSNPWKNSFKFPFRTRLIAAYMLWGFVPRFVLFCLGGARRRLGAYRRYVKYLLSAEAPASKSKFIAKQAQYCFIVNGSTGRRNY
ncbi:MAG: hypothetical protein ABSA77_05425, partial [Thermoguttaceae bacterium]